MSSESRPSGPLPSDVESSVRAIMHDVGIDVLKKKTLRKRLEAKYNIEFKSHSRAIDTILEKLLKTSEFQKELAKAVKDTAPVGGKGRKRSASKDLESKKASKEKKPDDYPKAALSAYLLFGNEHRDKVKEKDPNMKVTDVMRRVGEMWAQASDAEKEKYKRQADDDKKRFDREMEEYTSRGGTVFKNGGEKAKKKKKDENAPKNPVSAYFFFSNDYRKKHSHMKLTEATKAAGAAWKELSDSEKEPFKSMAEEDKKRYQREMAALEN